MNTFHAPSSLSVRLRQFVKVIHSCIVFAGLLLSSLLRLFLMLLLFLNDFSLDLGKVARKTRLNSVVKAERVSTLWGNTFQYCLNERVATIKENCIHNIVHSNLRENHADAIIPRNNVSRND